jgi:hypothetical protein
VQAKMRGTHRTWCSSTVPTVRQVGWRDAGITTGADRHLPVRSNAWRSRARHLSLSQHRRHWRPVGWPHRPLSVYTQAWGQDCDVLLGVERMGSARRMRRRPIRCRSSSSDRVPFRPSQGGRPGMGLAPRISASGPAAMKERGWMTLRPAPHRITEDGTESWNGPA